MSSVQRDEVFSALIYSSFAQSKVVSSVYIKFCSRKRFVVGVLCEETFCGGSVMRGNVLWQEKYRAVEETFCKGIVLWSKCFVGKYFVKGLQIIWSSFNYQALYSERNSFLHAKYFKFSCLLHVSIFSAHQTSFNRLN